MADPPPSRFCALCSSIFKAPKELETQLTASHHTDAASLKVAADAGCYICLRIWRELVRRSNGGGLLGIEGGGNPVLAALQLSSLRYWLAARGEERFELNFDVRAQEIAIRISFLGIEVANASHFSMQSSLAQSTRSRQSLQQAKDWIARCRNSHDYCRRAATNEPLPTRLVFVERNGAGSELSAHVCAGALVPADTSYLTLSHCWGPATFLTLNKENLELFRESIPITALSRAFQDALYMTVELGFNYLWIDSLCIVQDDTTDWLNEAKLMGQVYKNAACNLSASGFESGVHGFLLERRTSDPSPPSIHLNWGNLRSTALRHRSGKEFAISQTSPWLEIWDAPLFNRAWVLQEQILAPRALHFGTDQIFWECNDRLANEVWPLGWAARGSSRHPFQEMLAVALKRQPFWLFSLDKLNGFKNLPPHDIWRKIVENYSVRRLTISTDRLPALSGIATEFSKILNDSYVFGLWKSDLHLGLLWRQTRPTPTPPSVSSPTAPGIPTWSWASLDQPVHWVFPCSDQLELHSGFNDRLSQILEYSEDAVYPSLRIRGNLMRLAPLKGAHISPRHLARNYLSVTEREGYAFDLDFDHTFLCNSTAWQPHWHALSALVSLPEDQQKALLDWLFETTFFLPMLYTRDIQRMGAIGLLLKRQLERGRAVYRRVGTANMWSDFTEINRNAFVNDAWYYQREFTEDDFLEYDQKGFYHVVII